MPCMACVRIISNTASAFGTNPPVVARLRSMSVRIASCLSAARAVKSAPNFDWEWTS